jgi:hypothetical protein
LIFGKYLSEFKLLDLKNMFLPKLEKTLLDIKYIVKCYKSKIFGRKSFGMIMKLSETMLVKNRINCRNLALQLTQNEKTLKLVDRKWRLLLSPEY